VKPARYLLVVCLLGVTSCSAYTTTIDPPCNYSHYYSEPALELTREWQTALGQAGIKTLKASVEESGETCVNSKTGEITSYSPRQDTFFATLSVESLEDYEMLGNLSGELLDLVDAVSHEKTPNAYISFTFVAGDKSLALPVYFLDDAKIKVKGLSGTELFKALTGL
jgi:hypothetical protein